MGLPGFDRYYLLYFQADGCLLHTLLILSKTINGKEQELSTMGINDILAHIESNVSEYQMAA